jgi:hypothetical protein
MSSYRTISYTTTGTKAALDLDWMIVPFNVSINCTLTTGPVSYKLQFSPTPMLDLNGLSISDANASWFDSGDIPAATTTSASTSLTSPVARVRLVIATLTAGSLAMEILQGISTN